MNFKVTFPVPREAISTGRGRGTVILGQDADALGGDFDENQALSGSISEFNMWNRALDDEEVQQLSNCKILKAAVQGNIVDWSNLNVWEKHNVTIQDVDNVCRDDLTPNFIIFNQRLGFSEIQRHCKILGGSLEHQFDSNNELLYYTNIFEIFEKNIGTKKSPCVSKTDGSHDISFWIGFQIKGIRSINFNHL